jgi:hypothetical protein
MQLLASSMFLMLIFGNASSGGEDPEAEHAKFLGRLERDLRFIRIIPGLDPDIRFFDQLRLNTVRVVDFDENNIYLRREGDPKGIFKMSLDLFVSFAQTSDERRAYRFRDACDEALKVRNAEWQASPDRQDSVELIQGKIDTLFFRSLRSHE